MVNSRLPLIENSLLLAIALHYNHDTILESWIIDRYFSTFAYHTTLRWWVFALALVIVLIVTLTIVVVRSWSAATSNPGEVIKAE